jgi:hypothetical protein
VVEKDGEDQKWWEDKEEDVSSHWIPSRKRENTVN